jgi:hypothetical protein
MVDIRLRQATTNLQTVTYSSPSSDYQTPGTDYQSQNDSYEPSPENNQSVPNPTRQIYVPIVETFPPDHDGNGTYHLGGQILADGGSSPFEVGIVLSTKISLSDPIRIATQPDQNSSVFMFPMPICFPVKLITYEPMPSIRREKTKVL